MDYGVIFHIIKERFMAFAEYTADAAKFYVHRGVNSKRFYELSKFKNIYKNERCFLIGSGPSLTCEDLEKLKDEKTFMVNSVVLALNEISYMPTFYGFIDGACMRIYGEKIINSGIKNIFFAKRTDLSKADYRRLREMGAYEIPQMNTGKWIYYAPKIPRGFSEDITKDVYWGYMVVYSMMQVIVYMGFKEIYMLGMDCNYKPGEASFKDCRSEEQIKQGIPENYTAKYIIAHEEIKRFADKHNIKVYNATRGGMLEVYPRVNLDDIV